MSKKLFLMIVAVASVLHAQNEPAQPVPTEEARPAFAAPGELPALTPESTEEGAKYLIGGINVGANFDDNAFSENANKVGDVNYSARPYIGYHSFGQKLDLTANYGPGWSWDQRLSNRNVFSQDSVVDLKYKVKPHWTIGLNNLFHVSTNRLDQIFLPESGNVVNLPNNNVVTPIARQLSEVAGADLTVELSRRSVVGASGGYALVQYDSLAGQPGAQLIDSRNLNARGFYNYRINRRNTSGILYSYQSLSLESDTTAHTDSHSLFYTHRVDLTKNSNLQFFVGPEFSETHDQLFVNFLFFVVRVPLFKRQWSTAGGANYSWQGTKSGFRASFQRAINDGGGFFGASRVNEGHADFRRQFSRDWTGNVGAGYGNTAALHLGTAVEGVRTFNIGGGVTRRLGENAHVDVNYAFVHQSQSQFFGQRESDHNRIGITLGYEIKHLLRR